MNLVVGGILVLVLGYMGAAKEGQDMPATPMEQFQTLAKEFSAAANAY